MGIFYLTTWNRVLPIKDRRRSNPSQHHNACTKLSLLSANQEPPRLEGCFQIPKCPFPFCCLCSQQASRVVLGWQHTGSSALTPSSAHT